ncbi:MAG TPA: hypothetical protein VN541_19335, partial [Tepidisphaeraceae bacterium]|nr:hypothetical protein [Tepidisphaeraceae bacterium]
MKGRILLGSLALSLGTIAPAFGQAAPAGPPDFAQMRQQMEQHLKDLLGASDNEWKVLQPKIEKVRQAQRSAGQGGPMGFFFGPPPGGPGGPDGAGGPPPPPPGDAGGPPPGPDGNAQPSDVQ